MDKILLTGANGLVGQTLVHRIVSLPGFRLLATSGSACIVNGLDPEMTSVIDFALNIARFFKLDESLIAPIHSGVLNQPGRRPPSTGFIVEKAKTELGYSPKNLEEGLAVVQNLIGNFL